MEENDVLTPSAEACIRQILYGTQMLFILGSHIGLDGLVHPLTPGTQRHRPASEFVHDHDLVALDDVLFVTMEELAGH